MGADKLATYVHNHLAGGVSAIDILEDLRDDHKGEPLGAIVSDLLTEVQEDLETLRYVEGRLKGDPSKLKETLAWFGAKLTRAQLGRDLAGDFGVFQALEILSLGILGKQALWRVLGVVLQGDSRFPDIDFSELAARAEKQHARVEEQRIAVAQKVFQGVEQPA